jgi:hypothetical protein
MNNGTCYVRELDFGEEQLMNLSAPGWFFLQ